MKRPNGVCIYAGPSMLDGAPIVVIVTGLRGKGANAKTGAMLQTWILRSDVDPLTALRTGQDASICGDCKHRPNALNTCYVRVYQAPLSVYRAFKRGVYAATPALGLGSGRAVRLGSYGDPAAVPVQIWRDLLAGATKHTGYTHQWLNTDLAGICMASADTPTEREMAQSIGYRTFTVRTPDQPLAERESICPASKEAGYKLTCSSCGACNGANTGRRGHIAIVVHGAKHRSFTVA